MTVRALHEGDIGTPAVCIIGAGVAGLVAARRLAQAGISVAVLESGGRGDNSEPSTLNAVDDVNLNYPGAVTGRFRGLGGTSLKWGGRLLPLTAADIGERDHLGLPAWPLRIGDLDKYIGDIERMFGVDSASYEEDVLDAFDMRGPLPRCDFDFTLRCPKWVAFNRCHVGRLLQRDLEGMKNLDVRLDATVVGFTVDPVSGRLQEVTARDAAGRRVRVGASEFLVTAGTIESTRLLLNLQRSSGGRVFEKCRALGRYFQEHLGAKVADLVPRSVGANEAFGYRFIRSTRRSVHLELTAAAQRAEHVASAFGHVIMAATANSSTDIIKRALRGLQGGKLTVDGRDIVRLAADSRNLIRGMVWRYGRRRHFWPGDLKHTLNVWIEQAPSFENRISLSEKTDSYGVPLAKIEWRPRETEEQTFQACVRRLRSYWERNGCSRYCGLEWVPQVESGLDRISDLSGPLLHPSGSTRLGTDPSESVVDAQLCCHDVPNLRIASASVFPTAGSANPTLSIMQIALRAADAIASRLAERSYAVESPRGADEAESASDPA